MSEYVKAVQSEAALITKSMTSHPEDMVRSSAIAISERIDGVSFEEAAHDLQAEIDALRMIDRVAQAVLGRLGVKPVDATVWHRVAVAFASGQVRAGIDLHEGQLTKATLEFVAEMRG